jgi:hypothetical protein
LLARRALILSLGLLVAAGGCASGGGSRVTPATADAGYAGSSAAQHILANAGARAAQSVSASDADDGGRGQLVLPSLNDCGNGTFATDCSVWVWSSSPHGTRAGARTAQSVVNGSMPVLNFCDAAGAFPGDFTPAAPAAVPQPTTFALGYNGTHLPPIVTFNTRPAIASVTNTFAPTSDVTPGMTLTPTLSGAAARGWLVFFTWSWPADILLVPYAIDEIQLGAGSSPLVVPHNGTATLTAYDCLGRSISAVRQGSGFGFSPDQRAATTASSGPELRATVYGGAAQGSVLLSDDRGARTVAPVSAGTTSGR